MNRRFHRAAIVLVSIALAPTLPVDTLRAHCRLNSPNGGEVLHIGSSFTIQWTELVPHGVVNWDLYYSTTGSSGPWTPIALDLPPSSRSFVWNVQLSRVVSSNRVRLRVVQDMLSFSYDDVSDGDLTILPSLTTNLPGVSVSSGGAQDIRVDAGSANRGLPYIVLGSSTGTSPGQRIAGALLSLNADSYFAVTLGAPNTAPLESTLGTLDANGRATAKFVLPPGLPPALQGLRLHHAAVVLSASGEAIALASNPVALTFQP